MIIFCLFIYLKLCFSLPSNEFNPELSIPLFNSLIQENYPGCGFALSMLEKYVETIMQYDPESLLQQNWFDVGSNQGQFSIFLNRINNNANIYAFEPFDPVYHALYLKVQDIPKISLNHLAISNETGIKPFYTLKGEENSNYEQSSLSSLYNGYYIYQYINTSTLNDFMKKSNINNIFFMKIDTEGYDGIIINNSKKLFKDKKIKYLYFEYHTAWSKSDPTIDIKVIANILENNGYNLYLEYSNAIYVTEKILSLISVAGNPFCINFLAIRKGNVHEREIMRRLCPICGY